MRKLISIFLLAGISGCISDPAYFKNTSTQQLCIDYLTLPSYNMQNEARAAALAQRRENCSAYQGMANAKLRADQQSQQNIRNLQDTADRMNPSYNRNPTPAPRPPTQTYCTGSGNSMTCTTY